MSERWQLSLLRLLALALAVVLWANVTVTKREKLSEKQIDASLSYNTPRGMVLLDPAQTVKVRLRGPDRRIRTLVPFVVDVVVDLSGYDPGRVEVDLGPENVLRPDDVEVLSVEPSHLRLTLDRVETRAVPIEVRFTGEPAGGSIPGPVRTSPERALVQGPATRLAALGSVATQAISLNGRALSFSQGVGLVPPGPLLRILEPGEVQVQVTMLQPDLPLPGPESESRPKSTGGTPRSRLPS